MARSNPVGTIDQRRYTVEVNGKFATVRSCNSAVGVAVECCNLRRPISWEVVPDPEPYAHHTIVNGTIHVYEHKF